MLVRLLALLVAASYFAAPGYAQPSAPLAIMPNDARLDFLGTLVGRNFDFQGQGAAFKMRSDGGVDVPVAAGYRIIVYLDSSGAPRAYYTAGMGKAEGKLVIGSTGFKFILGNQSWYILQADKEDLHLIWMKDSGPEPKLIMYQRYASPRAQADKLTRQAGTNSRLRAELFLGFSLKDADAALNRAPFANQFAATTPPPSIPSISVGAPPAPTAFAARGPRLALVIGNAAYTGGLGALANPVNDARLVSAALRRAGFEVIEVLNTDQRAMRRAIISFGQRLAATGKGGTGLFYYAGHGVQSRGINYLVPVGAAIEAEADVQIEAVEADTVLRQMEEAGISTSIVVLDACRNLPVQRGLRDASRGLARMDAPSGSFVAYSTAPGSTAADGTGANSPFARAFVAEVAKPSQPIEVVFRNVRRSVAEATSGKQTPWDSSSLFDSFVFTP